MIVTPIFGEGPLLAQSGHSKHRLRPVRDVLRDRNDLKRLTGAPTMTSGLLAKGRFGKRDFVYVAADDVYLYHSGA